jgi:putative FmdB family regulatory protein
MAMYNYLCECGHRFDAFRSMRERAQCPCPRCGKNAAKAVTCAHLQLPGWDTAFPTASRKWERAHEKANMDELTQLGLR